MGFVWDIVAVGAVVAAATLAVGLVFSIDRL
jgi:hypothetical protein